MAPRGAAQRSDRFYELGRQGRKTGVTLPDTGEPDEHGLRPIDGLFSSPQRPGAEDTGEQDMELASSSGPGPASMLKNRLQIPRGRSPAKTNLQSPALKNPHLGPTSSPARGTIVRERDPEQVANVARRLDFKKAKADEPRTNGRSGHRLQPPPSVSDEGEVEEGSILRGQDHDLTNGGDESMQMITDDPIPDDGENVDAPDPDDQDDSDSEIPAVTTAVKTRRPGRPRKSLDTSEDQPVAPRRTEAEPPKKRPGRPPAHKPPPAESASTEKSGSKRGRVSKTVAIANDDNGEDEAESTNHQHKKQRTGKTATTATATTTASSSKPAKPAAAPVKANRGRKRKSLAEDAGDTSLLAVQRGPPLPKSRGLVSLHRDGAVKQTRSGRSSYKPLEFWKGEHVEYAEEAMDDMFRKDSRFILPSIREVVRVDEEETKSTSRRGAYGKSKSKSKGKRREEAVEEVELEDWERDPGNIEGDVILWKPEHEFNPPGGDDHVDVVEERLAISSEAVMTKDIKDATFRFAKTTTLPFMGSGIVDLPPGAEKKPKNSRKMHMVFFVFYGKATVTVNSTTFIISPGGQWFVPRGNYYSIKNETDQPARIFFAQACEMTALPSDEEE